MEGVILITSVSSAFPITQVHPVILLCMTVAIGLCLAGKFGDLMLETQNYKILFRMFLTETVSLGPGCPVPQLLEGALF